MDSINKVKSISIWIFIIPFIAVNTCLVLITTFHDLFPNKEDVELARCDTIGISSTCAGLAGLITAQKTINTILEIKDENNIITLINANNFSINNIKVINNVNCLLNNS